MIIYNRQKIKKERIVRKKAKGKRWLRRLLILSLLLNTFFILGGFVGGGVAIRKAIKKGKFQSSFVK